MTSPTITNLKSTSPIRSKRGKIQQSSSSSTAINEQGTSKTVTMNLSSLKGHKWKSFCDISTALLDANKSDEDETKQKTRHKSNVMRLDKSDMGLFGLCPESDPFYAVVCDYCDAVVKPQGLEKHLINRHNIRTNINDRLFGSCSNINYGTTITGGISQTTSSAQSSGTSSTYNSSYQSSGTIQQNYCNNLNSPMAPPLTNIVTSTSTTSGNRNRNKVGSGNKIKSKSGKSHLSSSSASSTTPNYSTTAINENNNNKNSTNKTNDKNANNNNINSTPSSTITSNTSIKHSQRDSLVKQGSPVLYTVPPFTFATASSSTTISSTLSAPQYDHILDGNNFKYENKLKDELMSVIATAALSKRKTSNNSNTKLQRKLIPIKDREYQSDIHCGVMTGNGDNVRPCTRSLTCKIHSITLRRLVQGRSDNFDKLLTEHRLLKPMKQSQMQPHQQLRQQIQHQVQKQIQQQHHQQQHQPQHHQQQHQQQQQTIHNNAIKNVAVNLHSNNNELIEMSDETQLINTNASSTYDLFSNRNNNQQHQLQQQLLQQQQLQQQQIQQQHQEIQEQQQQLQQQQQLIIQSIQSTTDTLIADDETTPNTDLYEILLSNNNMNNNNLNDNINNLNNNSNDDDDDNCLLQERNTSARCDLFNYERKKQLLNINNNTLPIDIYLKQQQQQVPAPITNKNNNNNTEIDNLFLPFDSKSFILSPPSFYSYAPNQTLKPGQNVTQLTNRLRIPNHYDWNIKLNNNNNEWLNKFNIFIQPERETREKKEMFIGHYKNDDEYNNCNPINNNSVINNCNNNIINNGLITRNNQLPKIQYCERILNDIKVSRKNVEDNLREKFKKYYIKYPNQIPYGSLLRQCFNCHGYKWTINDDDNNDDDSILVDENFWPISDSLNDDKHGPGCRQCIYDLNTNGCCHAQLGRYHQSYCGIITYDMKQICYFCNKERFIPYCPKYLGIKSFKLKNINDDIIINRSNDNILKNNESNETIQIPNEQNANKEEPIRQFISTLVPIQMENDDKDGKNYIDGKKDVTTPPIINLVDPPQEKRKLNKGKVVVQNAPRLAVAPCADLNKETVKLNNEMNNTNDVNAIKDTDCADCIALKEKRQQQLTHQLEQQPALPKRRPGPASRTMPHLYYDQVTPFHGALQTQPIVCTHQVTTPVKRPPISAEESRRLVQEHLKILKANFAKPNSGEFIPTIPIIDPCPPPRILQSLNIHDIDDLNEAEIADIDVHDNTKLTPAQEKQVQRLIQIKLSSRELVLTNTARLIKYLFVKRIEKFKEQLKESRLKRLRELGGIGEITIAVTLCRGKGYRDFDPSFLNIIAPLFIKSKTSRITSIEIFINRLFDVSLRITGARLPGEKFEDLPPGFMSEILLMTKPLAIITNLNLTMSRITAGSLDSTPDGWDINALTELNNLFLNYEGVDCEKLLEQRAREERTERDSGEAPVLQALIVGFESCDFLNPGTSPAFMAAAALDTFRRAAHQAKQDRINKVQSEMKIVSSQPFPEITEQELDELGDRYPQIAGQIHSKSKIKMPVPFLLRKIKVEPIDEDERVSKIKIEADINSLQSADLNSQIDRRPIKVEIKKEIKEEPLESPLAKILKSRSNINRYIGFYSDYEVVNSNPQSLYNNSDSCSVEHMEIELHPSVVDNDIDESFDENFIDPVTIDNDDDDNNINSDDDDDYYEIDNNITKVNNDNYQRGFYKININNEVQHYKSNLNDIVTFLSPIKKTATNSNIIDNNINDDDNNIKHNRRKEFPGVKKWYRTIPKPSVISTTPLKRCAGGLVTKNKMLAFRRAIINKKSPYNRYNTSLSYYFNIPQQQQQQQPPQQQHQPQQQQQQTQQQIDNGNSNIYHDSTGAIFRIITTNTGPNRTLRRVVVPINQTTTTTTGTGIVTGNLTSINAVRQVQQQQWATIPTTISTSSIASSLQSGSTSTTVTTQNIPTLNSVAGYSGNINNVVISGSNNAGNSNVNVNINSNIIQQNTINNNNNNSNNNSSNNSNNNNTIPLNRTQLPVCIGGNTLLFNGLLAGRTSLPIKRSTTDNCSIDVLIKRPKLAADIITFAHQPTQLTIKK